MSETELQRSPAQFFFEVGFGACWAEAYIRNGETAPFELTDAVIARAWKVSPEAHDDHEEFDRQLALANMAELGADQPPVIETMRADMANFLRETEAKSPTQEAVIHLIETGKMDGDPLMKLLKRTRHDERRRLIAQGCIHTRKAGEHADYDRPDLSAWQTAQSEWFDPTILEIVSEYAAWRDQQAPSDNGLRTAARELLDGMASTYKARNGREVGIEADDGEKCWIVHSDLTTALEGALADNTLPQDGIDLVIAARVVAFEDQSAAAIHALDKATEAFSERVPWDDQPEEDGLDPRTPKFGVAP